MKKNNNLSTSPARTAATKIRKSDRVTIGMDLGDKTSRYCARNGDGDVLVEGACATTRKGMAQLFEAMPPCRVAIEVGSHSRWASEDLKKLGHEVIVANARQVKLISQSSRKNDKPEAEMPARLARVDPGLLRPIRHRSEEAQKDLTTIRIRAALVEARTQLVNAARGVAKAAGATAGVLRCGSDGYGKAGGAAGGSAGIAAAAGATGGIADGKHQGV